MLLTIRTNEISVDEPALNPLYQVRRTMRAKNNVYNSGASIVLEENFIRKDNLCMHLTPTNHVES